MCVCVHLCMLGGAGVHVVAAMFAGLPAAESFMMPRMVRWQRGKDRAGPGSSIRTEGIAA